MWSFVFGECNILIFTESLRKNFQFQNVYNRGKSYADKYFVVFVKKNNLSVNRLGVCVSKKVGKSYVRSRITRLIKENYRLNEKYFMCGFDIVVMARKPASSANFYQVKYSIINLLHKHKIFSDLNLAVHNA